MSLSDTSLTLLRALKESNDRSAWDRFDARYRPMLTDFATSVGLHDADTDEIAQQTIIAFSEGYRLGKYDRERGKLRNWLFGVARNLIAHLMRERAQQPTSIGDANTSRDALALISNLDSLEKIWETQWQGHIVVECINRARAQFTVRDIQIFERLTLQQHTAEQVGTNLVLSPEAVRKVKHRVLAYIRTIRKDIEAEWEGE